MFLIAYPPIGVGILPASGQDVRATNRLINLTHLLNVDLFH